MDFSWQVFGVGAGAGWVWEGECAGWCGRCGGREGGTFDGVEITINVMKVSVVWTLNALFDVIKNYFAIFMAVACHQF